MPIRRASYYWIPCQSCLAWGCNFAASAFAPTDGFQRPDRLCGRLDRRRGKGGPTRDDEQVVASCWDYLQLAVLYILVVYKQVLLP